MDNYGPTSFGVLNAEGYDENHDPGTTDATVAFISQLVGAGSILELAIGTGRVALPLAALGFKVSGIEASPEMVAQLREKPFGDAIPVMIGDFSDSDLGTDFDHVFVVFNTLFNLESQEDQVRCFENVARCLKPGGTFLVETFVPNFSGFVNNQRVQTRRLDMTAVWLEAAIHDPIRQVFDFQRMKITSSGTSMVPLPMRYAWPAEIDLMARLAGLRLQNRWGDWDMSRFTADSKFHISVYEKPAQN